MVEPRVKSHATKMCSRRDDSDVGGSGMAARKWKLVCDFPVVAERVASFVDDGLMPQPDPKATYYFVPIDQLRWPSNLNRGWATTHAPGVYARAAQERHPDISEGELLVASTSEFGDVLLVPEQYLIALS